MKLSFGSATVLTVCENSPLCRALSALQQRPGGIMPNKIKLQGFNNLTKSLSFCIYDICYAETPEQKAEYIRYIDEKYNAERFTEILTEVCQIIGANILNIARQDYDPQGASVTMLVAEEPVKDEVDTSESPGPAEIIVAHLDKSHICVHTYPETHPNEGICTFRADIEVSTCGIISPLKALNYLIHQLDSDIVTVDYRVRGFTRDVSGKKHYIDHEITSIQNYFTDDTESLYKMIDVNVYQENIFHTKMMLNDFDLNHYLFGTTTDNLTGNDIKRITNRLDKEMHEIFYGRNMPDMWDS
jgi:S-adenosylmethionine decarboxylase